MLKLNRIAPARLQSRWREGGDELPQLQALQAGEGGYDAELGELALELGLVGHAIQQDPAPVAAHLRLAARHLSQALALRDEPDPQTHRSPYQAETWLNVVGAFGTEADRLTCAALQAWQLRSPSHAQHQTQAHYLALLQAWFGGKAPDAVRLRAIVVQCEGARASREDRRFVQPACLGLDAVARHDAQAWNLSLAQLVAAHAEEARGGDFKLQAQGLICLRALMLARFGRDGAMQCSVASDYLPLWLLDQG